MSIPSSDPDPLPPESAERWSARPSPLQLLLRNKLVRLGLGCAVLGLVTLLGLALIGITPLEILGFAKDRWHFIDQRLRGVHPAWIFLIIAILPATPIPASLIVIPAGIALKSAGLNDWQVGLLVGIAAAINIGWSYFIASGPGRNFIDWVLRRSSVNIPSLTKGNAVSLTLLLRLTPGIPYFLHALVLGFMRVPYRIYLPISLVTSLPILVAFALLGNAAADGNLAKVMLFIGIIAVLAIGSRFLHKALAARKTPAGGEPGVVEAEILDERTVEVSREEQPKA